MGIFGFGVHWFLQPLVLGRREGAKRLVVENASHGSPGLRKTVEYAPISTLLAGMLMRYGFQA